MPELVAKRADVYDRLDDVIALYLKEVCVCVSVCVCIVFDERCPRVLSVWRGGQEDVEKT